MNLELIKKTIRMLIEALDVPVNETNYVDRLAERQDAIEVAEIVYSGLKNGTKLPGNTPQAKT